MPLSELSLAAEKMLLLVFSQSFHCFSFCDSHPFLSVSWLVPPSLVSSLWVPLIWSLSSHVLTYPFLCGLQEASAPHSVAFFLCPDMSLTLWSPVCECPSLSHFLSMSWHVAPSGLQEVSTPCLVAFFLYLDLSLPLWFPVGKCPLLSCFPSVSWFVLPSLVSSL